MPLTIRQATVNDISAIRLLEQKAPRAAHWPSEEYGKLVQSEVVLVAERQGEVCGFVCARSIVNHLELESIVVAPEALRQGIAESLMRALLNQARLSRQSKVLLEVRESNAPARRLYEKFGFTESGRRRHYYQNPAEDAILYERSIE